MGKTFAEKALGKAAGYEVSAGDVVTVYPRYCLSHENSSSIAATFRTIGVEKVFDPERIVIVFDHTVPAPGAEYANSHMETRKFVAEQGIEHFYDMNCRGGICHQIMCQEGYAAPGRIIVGSDSHTCTYGAMGSFSTGIGRSEMAATWATGKIWLRVPETMKIQVEGRFRPGVAAKDLILTIAGDITASGADYLSIEFHGSGISDMSVAERMTLCNMAIEIGAKNAVCRPDQKVFDMLDAKGVTDYEPVWADGDAEYCRTLTYRLEEIEPTLAMPGRVDNRLPLREAEGTPIDQVFIGTCTNGRLEDLRVAADILRGRKVRVRTIVQPASVEILEKAIAEGIITDLLAAGCVLMHPGCGPCIGVSGGLLGDGEVCVSTANRNFTGRMGSKSARVMLASPVAAAASAVEGRVADPRKYAEREEGV